MEYAPEDVDQRRLALRQQSSALDWTIVRPNWFHQNVTEGPLRDIALAGAGTLRLPVAGGAEFRGHPGYRRGGDRGARRGTPRDVADVLGASPRSFAGSHENLGLTRSLATGYEIAPRGAASLRAIEAEQPHRFRAAKWVGSVSAVCRDGVR
ncbi:hypothetical protein ABZV58_28435 [Nocardia sp. NPDC004654]|uniref:hypothetical protein n=1 Tax=Nocardia sp. NPDC004654 TaxID=3154776 RepID=UPI0033AD51A0